MTKTAVLSLDRITKVFHRGDERIAALNGISFSIASGEFVSITGGSGSGKSTLLHILGLLDTATNGGYFLDGEDVSSIDDRRRTIIRNKKIGFIFQSFYLLGRNTALENVSLPLQYTQPALSRKEIAEIAKERLASVGLSARMDHLPNQLSGGQRQRVAIARALALNPAILLADEPTGNLDSKTSEEILSLFFELHGQGSTILLVTHDSLIAASLPRQIRLKDGVVEK